MDGITISVHVENPECTYLFLFAASTSTHRPAASIGRGWSPLHVWLDHLHSNRATSSLLIERRLNPQSCHDEVSVLMELRQYEGVVLIG